MTGNNLSLLFGRATVVFQETSLNDRELKQLASAIRSRGNVDCLALSGAIVDDAWLEKLADISGVEILILDSTSVSDDGLQILEDWPSIEILKVDGKQRTENYCLFLGAAM